MGELASIRPAALRRPALGEAALALVLGAAGLVELVVSEPPDRLWAAVVVVLASTLPLAWRESAPLLPVVTAAIAVLLFASTFGRAEELPLMLWLAIGAGLYSLGEFGSNGQLLIGGALAAVSYAALGVIEEDAGGTAFGALLSIAALGVGKAVRVMGFESDVLEARIDVLQEEQERRAREAVNAERARIARELHDVIGHSISVMGVQAGAVRRVLPPELAEERETLQAVERAGRDAVTEMRRLLDLMRSADEAPSAALPTLAHAPQLIADMRHAGLTIELEIDGELEDVPPGRGLAAYRIVQEALTNALKHAPDGRVRVSIRRTPQQLEVEVLQEARSSEETLNQPSRGLTPHGLVGMHERVALYGGRLVAGPGADGGFDVRAVLPLQAGAG
jgi:signal transduction histidine kinase